MTTFKIEQQAKGVYVLDVIGEDLADYSNVDLKDPLKQLNANIAACKVLEDFQEDSEIFQKRENYTVEDDLRLFKEVLDASLKKNPLMLLNECFTFYCSLTRNKSPRIREMIELVAEDIVSTSTAFVGCGGMLQEMCILTGSNCKYVYMVEDLQDYIETVTKAPDKFTIDPTEYYGKKDGARYARAKWALVKTYRYITFINWFKHMGQDIKLIVCDSEDAYAEAIKLFPKPESVIAIDIIDDFAESSLKTYYSCALMTPGATCLNASSGLLHLFRVNDSISNINFSSLDSVMKRISTDTTTIVKYNDNSLAKYGLMLGVAKWKVSDTKTKIRAVLRAALASTFVGALMYGLSKLF